MRESGTPAVSALTETTWATEGCLRFAPELLGAVRERFDIDEELAARHPLPAGVPAGGAPARWDGAQLVADRRGDGPILPGVRGLAVLPWLRPRTLGLNGSIGLGDRAPRCVGRFEKGIDYIGDVGRFAEDVAVHAAIAERMGPYKLSLHSGSDKLSIYPAFAAATAGRMHVKTSGTSYLEALHTIAVCDPDFVRDLYAFACERFAADRASYHVSVDLADAPRGDDPAGRLEDDDARRILHVTFGLVLADADGFGAGLRERLAERADEYADALEQHFARHLEALA